MRFALCKGQQHSEKKCYVCGYGEAKNPPILKAGWMDWTVCICETLAKNINLACTEGRCGDRVIS
jgi:hypothetical protein